MATKDSSSRAITFNYVETTNYLTISSDSAATSRYKCFTKFLVYSYLKGAFFKKSISGLGCLGSFLGVCYNRIFFLIKKLLNCKTKNVSIHLEAGNFNKALEITEETFTVPAYRGTDIFLSRFIMRAKNYKHANLHDISSINVS